LSAAEGMKQNLSGSIRAVVPAALAVALALLALNIGLAHHNQWPTPWIRITTEISPELVVLVLVVALGAAFGFRLGRAAQWGLATLLFIYVIGRYIDVTAPALFGRRIDLYWDSQHLPSVAQMALENRSPGTAVAIVLGVLAFIAASIFALRLAIKALVRASEHQGLCSGLIAISGSLLVMFIVGVNSPALSWERHFALPVTPVYWTQAVQTADRLTGRLDPNPAAADARLRPFAELNGRDVFVIFLESYGRIALDKAPYGEATRGALSALDTTLAEAGWQRRAAFVTSPTYGGASWLSHASLVAGYPVATHDAYQAFQFAEKEHLVDRFRRAGYRSVLLTPGIKGVWPAGQALRFDRIVAAADIPYSGPRFGFWNVPDQYSLDWLIRDEVETETRNPLFVMFPTVMSHFPFGPVPPYAEDWSALATAEPFPAAAVEASLGAGDALTGNREKAYQEAILYDLSTISGFVTDRAPPGAIVLVLGDHQPPAAISGEGEAWDVPVHVFARDPALLAAFDRAGFTDGVIPSGTSIGRLDELTGMLLEALETPSPSDLIAGVSDLELEN
jgi:hypothetical protein